MEQLLSDVTHSVHRIRTELVGGIEERREAVIGRGQSIVSQLESKLAQLQERRGRLEAQAVSDDHIGFLQVQSLDSARDLVSCLGATLLNMTVFHDDRVLRKPTAPCRTQTWICVRWRK